MSSQNVVSDQDSRYMTQPNMNSTQSPHKAMFTKTVGAGSVLSNTTSRRPELDHILNPANAHTQQNWILDNLSAFTS